MKSNDYYRMLANQEATRRQNAFFERQRAQREQQMLREQQKKRKFEEFQLLNYLHECEEDRKRQKREEGREKEICAEQERKNKKVAQKAKFDEYVKKAHAYLSEGRDTLAITQYDRALSEVEHHDLNQEIITAHYNRGILLLNQGRFNEAVKDFEKCFTYDDTDIHSYQQLGITYSRMLNSSKAIEYFQKTLSLDSKEYSTMGRLFFEQKNWQKAIAIFEQELKSQELKSLESLKSYSELLFKIDLLRMCSMAYINLACFKEAEEHFSAAIDTAEKVNTNILEYLLTLRGLLYYEHNQQNEASEDFVQAHQLNLNNPMRFLPDAEKNNVKYQHLIAQAYLNGCANCCFGKICDVQKAFYWFKRAADNNHRNSQVQVGKMYENGIGVTKAQNRAFTYYKKAADSGDVDMQYKIANMYEEGVGTRRNLRSALEYYTQAYTTGKHVDAAHKLVFMFKEGRNISPNLALNCAKWLAEQGNAEMAYEVIQIIETHQIDMSISELFNFYKQAADANPDCTYRVAEVYKTGSMGQSRDDELALQYYKKAAKLGSVEATYKLGEIYRHGECGVRANSNIAKRYLQKAATEGHPEAQNSISELNINRWCVIM